ncbi:MAG: TetR/AcrR family transcriptional regulator [Marinobacter sp.]|nr:TetR/AcrR family transcriptional regulator [Marinobacter sp.]
MTDTHLTPASHRERLIAALADVLEHKHFHQITLADIAAAARVSRRTFYEHFHSKEECLLALCEDVGQYIMTAIQAACPPGKSWREQVSHTTRAYLSAVQARPLLMRALYLELAALGTAGLAMRQQVAEGFAGFLQSQIELQRQRGEPLQPLSLPMGVAVVAGINELILHRLSNDQSADLLALTQDAEQLILRVSAQ